LAIFAIALVLPLAVLVRLFAPSMTERKYREWEIQGEIHSLAEQTLTAIPIVQAFGREETENIRYRQVAGRSVQARLHSEFAQHRFRVSTGTVTASGAAVVLLIGGISVLDRQITVGTLLVLVSYFAALYSPIETLAYLSEGFASAAAGAKRVLEVMEEPDSRIVDLPGAKPVDPKTQRGLAVSFTNVSFGYQRDKPVLHEISLQIEAGQSIALIGRTGAGKSTLVSLVPRLFDPWEGIIRFDGTDIRELQVQSVRGSVAIVSQQPFLLPLSIADNIAYGRPGACRDEIVAAAIAAKADDFIRRLPHGYETVIGERGVTLSGGERQRLSIARAIVKGAPLLVLDEPTSSLDAETEACLVEALEQLMQGRTTIIIAHRLSTIRRVDRIVLIEEGRVIEEGTHDELLAAAGKYQQLFRLQHAPAAIPPAVTAR
jgi:ATP-binding cassette, subfamily B, bacterial